VTRWPLVQQRIGHVPTGAPSPQRPDLLGDSYAATAFSDVLDRSVHATFVRYSGGLSLAAGSLTYTDWAVHLAGSLGKRLQLLEKASRKQARLSTHLTRCLTEKGVHQPCIAPWTSVYHIHALTESDVTFALTEGGHNAGVVAEPVRTDRTFQIREQKHGSPHVDTDTWQRIASGTSGSWWLAWRTWLEGRSGAPVGPSPIYARYAAQQNGWGAMARVGDYVIQGNTAQMRDPAFMTELKLWMQFNEAVAEIARDRLFSRSFGNPAPLTWLARAALPFFFTEVCQRNDKAH
jgi:hypothetical protein